MAQQQFLPHESPPHQVSVWDIGPAHRLTLAGTSPAHQSSREHRDRPLRGGLSAHVDACCYGSRLVRTDRLSPNNTLRLEQGDLLGRHSPATRLAHSRCAHPSQEQDGGTSGRSGKLPGRADLTVWPDFRMVDRVPEPSRLQLRLDENLRRRDHSSSGDAVALQNMHRFIVVASTGPGGENIIQRWLVLPTPRHGVKSGIVS